MRAPSFWRNYYGIGVALLAPASLAFRMGGRLRRVWVRPWRAPVPVLCVGGLVAGGSGKTPVAIALASWIAHQRMQVHILARGYRGSRRVTARPVRVDPTRHNASEVGDEALLLAAAAPTWVCRDRARSARAAVAAGAQVLLMDDGFQSPSLIKDVSLLVVDGTYGFGNRHVIPAGPLRERLEDGLARADGVVLVGSNVSGVTASLRRDMPVLRADLVPDEKARDLAERDVVAFAGIGHPEKFFRTLRDIGCKVCSVHAFDDHHPYRRDEIEAILAEADAFGARAVTTEKDAVRIPEALRARVETVRVSVAWHNEDLIAGLLAPILAYG